MIGIVAVVIILSLAVVVVFMKKKGSDELVLAPKQYDNYQPTTQSQQYNSQPIAMAAPTEVQRWIDAEGYNLRTMSDNSTEWWDGNDWQKS